MIQIPVSPGELIDKITILKLKKKFIKDQVQLKNVTIELAFLEPLLTKYKLNTLETNSLFEELYKINNNLWKIEDDIREKERDSDFGIDFVELARSVYFTNDKRSNIKKKINLLSGSKIIEEKSYEDY
jgi:hypothetical protein|tara:strand:- start:261 stop:644 length:384 start_codon:yes stop_codon:yes gene_type:complete